MREIILDTETTGLDPKTGDRIIEIGAVELLNKITVGKHYHQYINPERPVSEGAFKVHGLSDEYLSDKPVFSKIADEFLDFVEDAQLVIHNASFDMGFINHELSLLGLQAIPNYRIVDTLDMARRKHPGAQNNLDALCARYNIDNSKRDLHGALLDAELLCEVYVELSGGRQAAFVLDNRAKSRSGSGGRAEAPQKRELPDGYVLDEKTLQAHREFVATLSDEPLWAKHDSDIAALIDKRKSAQI